MKVALILSLLCVFSYVNCACFTGPASAQPGLSFCTEYRSSSCCTPLTEAFVKNNFDTKIAPIFGTDGCGMNVKALICASACSPDQSTAGTAGVNSLHFNVAENFTSGIFDSCKGRCVPTQTVTYSQVYSTSAAFLTLFNSANDPTFVPSLTNPNVSYTEVEDPAEGTALEHVTVPASGTDLDGCQSGSGKCIDPFNPTPVPRNLDFCVEYAASACCNLTQEAELKNNFIAKVEPIFGTNGCGKSIKTLFCAWLCSPEQGYFVNFQLNQANPTQPNQTIYINPTFAEEMWDSCENRCFTVPGQTPLTLKSYFGTSANPAVSFLQYFNSANDPSYTVDLYHPNIYYSTSLNPATDFRATLNATEGSGADLTGCSSTTGSSNDDSSSAVIVPAFFAIFAALFALL